MTEKNKYNVGSPYNIEFNILFGHELQIFLNSDHITPAEVNSILKSKGIFIGNLGKQKTVPLLAASLLTPDNFFQLSNNIKTRETREKIKIATLELTGSSLDWMQVVRNQLNLNDINPLKGQLDNVSFSKFPLLSIEKNKIEISYEVNINDYNEEWYRREGVFLGRISVEEKNNQLILLSNHTSKETEGVNKVITKELSQVLYQSKLVTTNEPNRILFSDFNNIERIRFFKRLTGGRKKTLEAGDVEAMKINLDRNEIDNIPKDDLQISWLRKIAQITTIGRDKLNDIFFISEEKYYQYYHILEITIVYPFKNIGANSGNCKISFHFSKDGRKKEYSDAELAFSIHSLQPDNTTSCMATKEIEKNINLVIQELIEVEYERITQERENQQVKPTKKPSKKNIPIEQESLSLF